MVMLDVHCPCVIAAFEHAVCLCVWYCFWVNWRADTVPIADCYISAVAFL